MKRCLLIACCLSCLHAWGNVPVRPLCKSLRPLNIAVFNHKISAQVTRQTFSQLVNSPQVAALTNAEQTLLLAHKFAQENQALPRTVIVANGKIVAPEEYTFAQKMEIELGNKIRYALKAPNTPPQIRREILQLQQNFSFKYHAPRTLEHLNEWLDKYGVWPRANIPKQGPLTAEEEFEVELAQEANFICRGRRRSIPAQLVAQICYVRKFYDPDYVTQTQAARPVKQNQAKTEGTAAQIAVTIPQQKNFYDTDNLPRNPATGRQEVRPTAQNLQATYTRLSQATIHSITKRLVKWMLQHNRWPTPLPAKSLGKYTFEDMQQEAAYQDMLTLQTANPALVANIDYTLTYQGTNALKQWLTNISNGEMSLKYYQLYHLRDRQEKILHSIRSEGMQETPQELFEQVKNWALAHQQWPRTFYLNEYIPLPKEKFEQAVLAEKLRWFIKNVDPDTQGVWQTPEASLLSSEILGAGTPYANPDLEQFRLLYQQYHP